jgi:type I restriction enzyme S subunit
MELINNYQVPPGYKKTEVGVIPEDWEVRPLISALKTSPKYGINAAAVPHQGDIPAYIRITDISEDGYFKPEKLVGVAHCSSSQYFLEEGDLVFARTGASVGKSYLYNPGDGRLVYAGFLIKLQADKNVLLPDFFAQYVKTKTYWDWVKSMSMRSGQPGINGNEYGQLLLPFPSVSEQKAIAQTLSDVDVLIDALDKLIAKKRHIKTGTMQQLLTGKTRLPGVRGEWEIKKVGTLGSTYGGLTGKKKSDFGNGLFQYITFLNIMNNIVIDTSILEKVNIKKNENQNAVKKNDLFFNTSSETPEEVGMCSILTEEVADVYLNSFCFGFRLEDNVKIDGLYLTYFFRSDQGRNLIYSLAQGATRYNLSKTNFLKLSLNLPLLPEQKAIAQVLSDMDKEITALEKRRTKTQAIKQGMMQELLTGKTRLI